MTKFYTIYMQYNNDIKPLAQFDKLDQVAKYLSINKKHVKDAISKKHLIGGLYRIFKDTIKE